jgi:membrane protease YdiL (CAAX protease family)
MDEVPAPPISAAASDVAISADQPSAVATPLSGGAVEDHDLKSRDLILDWWDACQAAFVFLATQYIASRLAELLGAFTGESDLNIVNLFADQLAVAVFPVAYFLRLQPRAPEIFGAPRPTNAMLLLILVASLPLIYNLRAATWGPVFNCGLPVIAANFRPRYLTIAGLFVTCICGPVIEEVFFRGILGRNLVARYGPIRGMLLTAVLFAAIRLDRTQMAPAFLLSIACHVLYLKMRSIYAPILLHSLVNSFGQSVGVIGNDILLLASAILAVSVLGYVIIEGRLQAPAEQLMADPLQSIGRTLASHFGDNTRRPTLTRTATIVISFLAPLPFYVILLLRIAPYVFG